MPSKVLDRFQQQPTISGIEQIVAAIDANVASAFRADDCRYLNEAPPPRHVWDASANEPSSVGLLYSKRCCG